MEELALKSLRIKLPSFIEVRDTRIINIGQLEALSVIEMCLERGVPVLIESETGTVISKLMKEQDEYLVYPVTK